MTVEDTQSPAPVPPVGKKVPVERTHHGDTFIDHYEWLRDKESQEVLDHLHAENTYTEAVVADQEPLRQAIFDEIKNHVVETDLSVPARRGNFWYFTRTIEGEQHPVYCRVPAKATGAESGAGASSLEDWTPPQVEPGVSLDGEEVYLDTNAEAAKHSFYSLGGISIDDAGTIMAYSEDTTGDEHFTLRFRDLNTGENLPEAVENVHGGPILEPAGRLAYYMVSDATWRPHRLYVHTVGTDSDQDQLLLEITDEQLWTFPYLSADKKQLMIVSGNSEYNETRILDVGDAAADPVLLIGAEQRLEHNVEPFELDGQRLLLITHNQDGENKSVSVTTQQELVDQAGGSSLDLGRRVLAHEESVKLDDSLALTASQILVTARVNTVESVYLLPLDTVRAVVAGGEPVLTSSLEGPQFEAEMYTAGLAQAEYDAPLYRVVYTSWHTPPRVYDIPHATGEPILRRETPVNDFDPDNYVAERLWAPTGERWPNGEEKKIPVTVTRRKEVQPDGTNPLVVYGYGSYEMSMDPHMQVAALSLLDRGVVFAIAHIRGGGELGRRWYTDGKKLNKINTFRDFITATDFLVDAGWGAPDRVAAMGGSAGGLLMGAVANMAPEKYRAIVAQVPFVDNVTSILDPELPLSALEWEEWGNPIADAEAYHYMKSYSPYENLYDTSYPAIAAVTSLHDTRVLYVEPAKWVQKLREHHQGDAPIVLKTEMEGGHGGASGRYETWRERAWDYAWLASWLEATELLDS